MAGAAFAEVYEELLPAVWRFVSVRVPERADAEDLTSEVFTRALESWPRYDPGRGTPVAWISGIARRVVADWWRDRRVAHAAADHVELAAPDADPSESLEDAELVGELRRALAALNERERDAIALRFAAELRHSEIAEILDSSTGAVKMMLLRTVMKLRAALAHELPSATDDEVMANSLDDAITAVIARRRASIPDPVLARVVQLLAVLHRAEVPADVRTRVKACIDCNAPTAAAAAGGGRPRTLVAGIALPSLGGIVQGFTAPACAVCAAAPVVQWPLYVLGLSGVGTVLHEGLWILAPLNVVLLWRSFRRHGHSTPLVLAALGAVLVLAHLASHILGVRIDPTQLSFWSSAVAIWAGAALLGAAVFVDRRAARPRRSLTMRAG